MTTLIKPFGMSLSAERIEQIEIMASDVLKQAFDSGINTAPVDLSKILNLYGLKLLEKDLPPGVSGEFNRQENTISISSLDDYPRISFTVAHELGHYFLHSEKTNDVFFRSQIINFGEKTDEQEANWFAASLLMPMDYFKKTWSVLKSKEKLATLFGVSTTSVHWRLKNLGLI